MLLILSSCFTIVNHRSWYGKQRVHGLQILEMKEWAGVTISTGNKSSCCYWRDLGNLNNHFFFKESLQTSKKYIYELFLHEIVLQQHLIARICTVTLRIYVHMYVSLLVSDTAVTWPYWWFKLIVYIEVESCNPSVQFFGIFWITYT